MEYLRDKDKKVVWSEIVRNDYDDEERFRKQHTHIFVKKESEFQQALRVVKKFKEYSSMEFDTIYKLYKTQNYHLTPELFVGTSYKYGTLSAFMSIIRLATKNTLKVPKNKTMLLLINDFVKEIKQYSEPFPLIFTKKCKVTKLIESGTLNNEELEFLRSTIQNERKPALAIERDNSTTTLKRRTNEMNVKSKKKRNRWTTSQDAKLVAYQVIVKNYNKSFKEVISLVPDLNPKTVENYMRICRHLSKGERVSRTSPTPLIEMWKKYNKEEPLSTQKLLHKTTPIVDLQNSTEYILVIDNKLVKSSSSVEFLKGFREAMIETTKADIKIYQQVNFHS